ncbi:uncharacterized protein LOC126895896 isoform X2 [Daktulosphaira vitifoliae]|uniref:uncharacterized protein LOC126895896 isoform X2 n=1 Tax=Daktulosphaira vitifoliae TaxID=58002 RepID=UPI0021A98D59|nr:uncharacterized protein LOC126895896 isoform X2 [Daktulosphaira vitifoliae]
MNFYFRFGILLCFMCLITIPTFSIEVPNPKINSLDEEYDLIEVTDSDEEIGPNEVIDYSDECKNAIKDFYNPSNEKDYPFSFFAIQHVLSQFFNISVENEEILLKRKGNIELVQQNNISMLLEIFAPHTSDNDLILRILNKFGQKKKEEKRLIDCFQDYGLGSPLNVSKDLAQEFFHCNSLFPDTNSEVLCNELLNNYTDEEDIFSFQKMRENVANDYKGDKSNILTYDNNQRIWITLSSQ